MRKLTFNEKFVLITFPLAGYALNYNYERNYLSHFGVPPDFIFVDQMMIIKALMTAVMLGFSMLYYMVPVFLQHNSKPTTGSRIAVGFSGGLVATMLWLVFVPSTRYLAIAAAVCIPGGIIVGLIWAVVASRKRTTDTRSGSDETKAEHAEEHYFLHMMDYGVLFTLLFFILGMHVSSLLGMSNAASQEYYMVIGGERPQAIIRCYSGKAIVMDVDLKSRTLSGYFSYIPLDSLGTRTFRSLPVGPLVVSKSSPAPTTSPATQP